MKRVRSLSYFRSGILVLLAIIAISRARAAVRVGQVTEVFLFSLQRPGNVDDENVLLLGAHSLRHTRGVVDFRAGRPFAADRAFDLAVVITFKDRNAFTHFSNDTHRQQNMEAFLRPLVRRYAVYSFSNE